MQTVSPVYTEMMEELIRQPSSMRLTFHYPTGNVVYTNADIVKVTESKSAHLIAGELPAIDLSVELINLDGRFNPNSPTGLHDMLMEGVKITYEYGFDIPNLNYYGYFDDGVWHDYGMEEGVPYGFKSSYYTEWLPGGEVFTSGEITYSKTTATIKAKDFLSFLDEKPVISYGNRTLAQIAKAVIELTDYPENDLGEKKLITGPELDAFSTTIVLSETEDTAVSAKEHLQTIAHAGGVQMYIDRFGYLHLDNSQQGTETGYHLPLSQQAENPQHNKEQMPKKLTVNLNSEYGSPVEVELKGGGEAMVVDNEFIVTTAEGEALRDRILDHFIKYRNTAEIGYRGEPALDILDTITIDADFGTYIPAIIVGSELVFDGTLSGSLVLRYQLGTDMPKKVLIKGGGNFIYPLGEHDIPSITSYTLVCETDYPTPSYQWSYYTVSNGQWLNISGETNSTLIVNYNSLYFDNDSSAKFRCIVNNEKGAFTQISKIMLQKDSDSGYRGAVVATTPSDIDVPNVKTGDVVLMDNTSDGTAEIYGEAYIYDGEEWTPTQSSDALAMTYKDALELAENSGKTIYASNIYADLIVAKKLRVQSGNFLTKINDIDGFDVTYNGNTLFKVGVDTGKIYFGEQFWYDPSDGIIHTPNDKTIINADGTIEAVDGVFSGYIEASSGIFKGVFDTTALKLEPSDADAYSRTESSVYTQSYAFYSYYIGSLGLTIDRIYRASMESGTYVIIDMYEETQFTFSGDDVAYIRIHWHKQDSEPYDEFVQINIYDISLNKLGHISMSPVENPNGYYTFYFTVAVTLTIYTGGDKLLLSSDVPTGPDGLSDYQIYVDPSTSQVKVKLPD